MKEQQGFTVYPAIDLRGGKVVRLAQGDPRRQTVYGDDPLEMARRWQAEGASWLHVVNLDGAFGETASANEIALSEILQTGLKVQFGGGIRDISGIQRALNAGISRVVIGTAAIENPSLIDVAMRIYSPEKVIVGIDAQAGSVKTRGWKQDSKLDAVALGRRIYAQGVRWCVFTDIERDGVSTGVNIPATVNLARETGLQVIASGGVSSLRDVEAAARSGLPGIIIGRALYEGAFTLRAALDSAKDTGQKKEADSSPLRGSE
ncbi:MAG: 1-(5-phosphoribosyl)-5-[(5-phosphoribosylamino)methylideneamino]imidazole-4-carboxamide isomerase [Anaerolineales bacterium]|nr:1-(5-phosphoribosyl)-5-[(5-phosphoribosylamino)methylideneamino]imidazole-4-carboxamide isomerase [Anaerolineales bacterium]